MKKQSYNIIGVMSGTSLDGIDLAQLNFRITEGKWRFKILAAETIGYSRIWKEELREAIGYSESQLERLDFKYTEMLAKEIQKFIRKNRISELDAVCSHGHTIIHKPHKGFTMQIGNLPKLAKILGQTVVCNFRVQDVELGGQGAPLVPIGDRLLFSQYDYCLNLGGFANCSYEYQNKRIAYDICPVNIVFNQYAESLGKKFDDKGRLAASGKVNDELLEQLNALEFYGQKPPKSLGLEWVRAKIFPLIDSYAIPLVDVLRTYTEHVAMHLCAQFTENASVLVTGGGAYNSFLIERLQDLCKVEIIIPASDLIEFKEALIFGFLGVLKLRGEVNCLASVTGAKMDHSSGHIYTV